MEPSSGQLQSFGLRLDPAYADFDGLDYFDFILLFFFIIDIFLLRQVYVCLSKFD